MNKPMPVWHIHRQKTGHRLAAAAIADIVLVENPIGPDAGRYTLPAAEAR